MIRRGLSLASSLFNRIGNMNLDTRGLFKNIEAGLQFVLRSLGRLDLQKGCQYWLGLLMRND